MNFRVNIACGIIEGGKIPRNTLFMKHIIIIFTIIISHSSSFGQQWKKIFTPHYFANWIIESYDKGYYILGQRCLQYDSIYTYPFTYDSLCPHPIVSDTIDPDCGLIVDIDEPFFKPKTNQLKVFPNPGTEKITVIFPKYLVVEDNSGAIKSITTHHQWRSTTLEVYNLKGERCMQRVIPKDVEKIELNISSWPKGMYFFRLVYNRQTVAGEKVVVN